MSLLAQMRGGLVVSCQPVDGGPMDDPSIVVAMALAAEAGGAAALRIEGVAKLRVVRLRTRLPIIGIVKRELAESPVRITPMLADIADLAAAGADVIAYDATSLQRPVATAALVTAIHEAGCVSMADCANLDDGKRARAEGAGILGTTLAGYAYEPAPEGAGPDLDLIAAFKALGRFVMAEGRINSPELAARARGAGADAVTVGSAITRIEHITGWFVNAISSASSE